MKAKSIQRGKRIVNHSRIFNRWLKQSRWRASRRFVRQRLALGYEETGQHPRERVGNDAWIVS